MFKIGVILLTVHAASAEAADWLQFGYDQTHSGYNPQEKGFPVAAANTAQWHVGVHAFGDGTVIPSDSTPVYLSGAATPAGTKDRYC